MTMAANDPTYPSPFPEPTEESQSPTPTREFSALPSSRRKRPSRRSRVLLAVIIMVTIASSVGLAAWLLSGLRPEPYNGPTHLVKRERLIVTVTERGALESAENSEIVCRVKAKSQSGVASTIKWVIDDGSQVKKGQLLIELDDSSQQDQFKTQKIEVDKAKADWVKAEQDYEIVRSQNYSDIETAKITRTLRKIELEKYLGREIGKKLIDLDKTDQVGEYLFQFKESSQDQNLIGGDYLQLYNDIDGRIENARSDREQWLDRAAWSRRMVKKGYVSRSQAESDEAKLASAEISLRKVQGEMKILREFTLQKEVMKLWSDVKEADRALDRVKTQAESNKEKAIAEKQAKRSVYMQQEAKLAEIEDEINKCRIYSPQDGLAVYFSPDAGRFGIGAQQSIVAQGENVKEGQKLLRIPNLAKMQVNVRVHEAMVSRLRAEVLRPTNYTQAIGIAMLLSPAPLALGNPLPMTDLLTLITGQHALTEVRLEFRDRDFEQTYPGQPANVRVEAYPNRLLRGHVKTVATVPSQIDFASADVKVYPTIISIDEAVENLRPGFSAEVTIHAEESSAEVLTIPIQAVVGNISMGAERKCFVIGPDGLPKERDIVVGMSNIKMVEVTSGLSEGDQVILNPRAVLPENSKLRPATPAAPSRNGGMPGEFGGQDGKMQKKAGFNRSKQFRSKGK